MYRFLALIWNSLDAKASRAASCLSERVRSSTAVTWSPALDGHGLAIFHAGAGDGACETRVLTHDAGVLLGRVFHRATDDPKRAGRVVFDEAESAHIVASGGLRLLERYWGRYVAIVRNRATGGVWILRDPSGGLPCLLTAYEGVHIVCSDLEDVLSTGLLKFSVNWHYIARWTAHGGGQVRETALNEVTEVLGGERVCLSEAKMQRSIEWDPLKLARQDRLEDTRAAVAALRATTRACVQAWAGCYRGLLHNLSGGLDSSIVLSCLTGAPDGPPVTCLHYFALGPHEDERPYARMMARHAGVELVECQADPATIVLPDLLNVRRSARPWFYLYELEHGRIEGELAARRRANALFSGAGGDGVFFQAGAELAVSDYLFEHGLKGLMRSAAEAARMSHKSVWWLLSQAVRARVMPHPWSPHALNEGMPRTLVKLDVLGAAARDREFVHPWFAPSATRGCPPGILLHASSVHVPPAYYPAFPSHTTPERVFPLLSQPLVELCLRIPSYHLIAGGRDRALARRAFAPDLPGAIVNRHAKGRIDQHLRNVLDANLDFVRELMLDGLLVKHGMLDRAELERYLTLERSPADAQYTHLLQVHLCTEVWLRKWCT